jgi:lysozyme
MNMKNHFLQKPFTKRLLGLIIIVAFFWFIFSLKKPIFMAIAEEFIKKYEGSNIVNGFHVAYPDSGGVWTIGYGNITMDGKPVKKGDQITEQKALSMLRNTMTSFWSTGSQMIKVALNEYQQAALLSFMYNVGVEAFRTSTLLKTINAAGTADEIKKQFRRWIYDNGKIVDGLVKRREAEINLYYHV